MNIKYVSDWQNVINRFEEWWVRADTNKPLMRIVAPGRKGETASLVVPEQIEEQYLSAEYIVSKYRNFCETHFFFSEAYPSISLDLGPGSMALYLGGEPGFAEDTIWFREFMDDCEQFDTIHYDEKNKWWNIQQEMLKKAVSLAKEDFYVNIPDIVENLDILSALRGPQELCYDILDKPDCIRRGVEKIDDLYFNYFDRCRDIVKADDNTNSYTAFNILGYGRTAKIQCDFCALISPDMFREYVQLSLRRQCCQLDHSVYHLDGPDAIKHLDALMEIEELDALQWTCGAGQPDGACEKWYPIYDKVRSAGKGLWIMMNDGGPEDWENGMKRLVDRYGKRGMYFLFPTFPDMESARRMDCFFD